MNATFGVQRLSASSDFGSSACHHCIAYEICNMCEILAEFLARGAYLARSADHTNRMPLDLIGATSVARHVIPVVHAASPDVQNARHAAILGGSVRSTART